MKRHRRMYVAICVSVASLLVLCGRAAGFNPQPEPPGVPSGQWYVEGYIDMYAMAVDPTGEEMPFGIDPDIVGDAMVDFSAGVIARFNAPMRPPPDDGKPVDGRYDVEFEYFQVRIGNTTWDQTMTMPDSIQFQVTDGVVDACSGVVTFTMPEHPDLSFALSTSPGTWEALDERNRVNLGVVTGTYSLRDATVPEPSTLVLLALGAVSLAWWRRRAWMSGPLTAVKRFPDTAGVPWKLIPLLRLR